MIRRRRRRRRSRSRRRRRRRGSKRVCKTIGTGLRITRSYYGSHFLRGEQREERRGREGDNRMRVVRNEMR
jgi:hypothetical protein